MAILDHIMLTIRGNELLTEAVSGKQIEFVKVVTGSGIFTENEDVTNLTSLKEPQQEFPFIKKEKISESSVLMSAVVSNEGAARGYYITEIGIYAKLEEEEEVLYAVIAEIFNKAYFMPPYNGFAATEMIFNCYITIRPEAKPSVAFGNEILLKEIEAESERAQLAENTLNNEIKRKLGKTETAAAAEKWSTERNINGIIVDGTSNRANYGTCSTDAATEAKTVSCYGFGLIYGSEISVKFLVTNTAENPTLNVSGTGAKPIYYRGSAIPARYLAENRTYIFRYNGVQWELVGDVDTSTTYPFYNKSLPIDFAEKFRTVTKGDTKHGNYISNLRTTSEGITGAPVYGSGIAFGSGDTHGYFITDYRNAQAFIGGGNADRLNWIKKIAFMDNIPAKVSQLENDSGYLNPGEKIAIWTDDEGGNLRIISPEGIIWEMDAHDGNFRIFTYENGIKLALEIDTAGKVTFPNTPVKTSTSLTATIPGIPLDQTAGKALKDQIDGMKTTFQAGVDALYDKCKSCGATPGAKTPAAISTAIQNIYTNRYNAGLSAGTSGKSNVWKSGEITAHSGREGGIVYFSISNFPNFKNITKDNINIEFTNIVSGSASTISNIAYTYNKTTGEIAAQCGTGAFYYNTKLVYQNFKAKITVIY